MYNVSQDYITAITNSSVYCQWLGTITTASHTTYSLTEKNIKAGSSKITWDGAGGDNHHVDDDVIALGLQHQQ